MAIFEKVFFGFWLFQCLVAEHQTLESRFLGYLLLGTHGYPGVGGAAFSNDLKLFELRSVSVKDSMEPIFTKTLTLNIE